MNPLITKLLGKSAQETIEAVSNVVDKYVSTPEEKAVIEQLNQEAEVSKAQADRAIERMRVREAEVMGHRLAALEAMRAQAQAQVDAAQEQMQATMPNSHL